MLDIKSIRENPEKVRQGVEAKGYLVALIDETLELDRRYRDLLQKTEQLRADRNKLGKDQIERGKEVKKELKNTEEKLKEIEQELQVKLNNIPNLPLDMVPLGKSGKDNVVVRTWGEPKKFSAKGGSASGWDFKPKDHLELGKNLEILDFEAGAKVAGSGFYFWQNEGALLELALVRYAFEMLMEEGFTPVITPDLARSRFYLSTGYLPKGDEAQTFTIEDQDLGLIATAEVALAGKHADEIIPENKLPLKYVGYSHCFRQEAGAYGQYSKGLFRVHQFTKVEIFIYCLPEESNQWHEKILEIEEKIYQGLGLPYRVVEMCGGDLGAMAARKFDIDVWMPSRDDYGEVTSTSNCTDYQARNLNIKVRRNNGVNEYLHMLNGTVIATSRTALAILENYQQKDGSIIVPEVLQKWLGKKVIKR